ncbi:MAG TPA: phosphatidate cytidylyltransferase [Euzebya sp.]|nr:phosphatidate cytidylyltransferase [Euzebya sp.]
MSDVLTVGPRVLVLFGAGGLCLLAARHRSDIAVLTARLRTWVVIAAVWFGAVALGRPGVVVMACACGVVATAEYGRLALPGRCTADVAARVLLVLAGGGLPVLTVAGGPTWSVALAGLLLITTLPSLVAQDVDGGLDRLGRTVLGVLWVGAACSALAVLPLRVLPLIGLATALADIGGFTGGALRGRHRLAPRLSPGKTVEGVVGSAVLATVGAALCADVAGVPLAWTPAMGMAIAVGATWGDLLESLLKRSAGCKDAGDWLPGFGGLLDRLDSLLVITPMTWALLTLMGS